MFKDSRTQFLARGILFGIVFLIVLCLCFTGCITNKTMRKMLEREDAQCEQAIKLAVIASRPQTGEKIWVHDTIIIRPPTIIDTFSIIKNDTVWQTIVKNNETIRWRIKSDTIQIQAICPEVQTKVTLTETEKTIAFTPKVLDTGIFSDKKEGSGWDWIICLVIGLVVGFAGCLVWVNSNKKV